MFKRTKLIESPQSDATDLITSFIQFMGWNQLPLWLDSIGFENNPGKQTAIVLRVKSGKKPGFIPNSFKGYKVKVK